MQKQRSSRLNETSLGSSIGVGVAKLHDDRPNELIPRVSIRELTLKRPRLPRYANTMEFSVIASICNSTRREIDSLFIFDFAPMEIVYPRPSFVVPFRAAGCGNLADRSAVTHPEVRGNHCGDFIVPMICRRSSIEKASMRSPRVTRHRYPLVRDVNRHSK